PQALLREVPDHGDEPVARPQPRGELVEPPPRALPNERVDRPLALQKLLHEVTPDESGRARHEVVHGSCSLVLLDTHEPAASLSPAACWRERHPGDGGTWTR